MSLISILGVASFIFVLVFTVQAALLAPGKGQSPRSSIIEAWINIVIGFSINFVAAMLVVPIATNGAYLSPSANFWMGWVYTVISIVRQYVIRRWFNSKLVKG